MPLLRKVTPTGGSNIYELSCGSRQTRDGKESVGTGQPTQGCFNLGSGKEETEMQKSPGYNGSEIIMHIGQDLQWKDYPRLL